MYVLSHGFLLSSYKAFFHLHTWFCLSCVLTSGGYKFLFVVYAFFLWESSYYEYCHVSHDVGIYCMLDLVDPYGRYYELPFRSRCCILDIILLELVLSFHFFHNWKDLHQWCRSTVSHNCTVSKASWILWKYCHILLYLGFFLELSSLVLRNKSHLSFLVGDCTWSFLQVKCTNCMIRNIS